MNEDTGSIQMDELTGDDVTDAFLSNLTGEPRKRSTETAEEASTAPAAETADEGVDTTTTAEDGDEAAETTQDDPEDTEVEIKVGEETKKAKLSALKRLFGQEAALTQKSQKAADLLRTAETNAQVASAHLERLTAKAKEAYEPYTKLDFDVLSAAVGAGQMTLSDFQALKADAARAKADLDYFGQEASALLQARQAETQRTRSEAAVAARAELEDPAKGIPGFGPELYGKINEFAKSNGMEQFHTVVQPAAIRLMHKAMLWDAHEKAAKSAETKVAKVVNKPTKVTRPGTQDNSPKGEPDYRSAMADLRKSGSTDAATAAFLASFSR